MKKYVIMILLALIICGCKTRYIQVEVPRYTERTKIEQRVDSIYVQDTIHIYQRGDTIFQDRIRYKYRDRYHTDTIIKVDSIPYKVVVDKPVPYVPKPIKALAWAGGFLIALGIGYILLRFRL